MVPRIWVVVLALLLLAAPADETFELVDAQAANSICDDDAFTHLQVVPVARPPDRTLCATRPEGPVPPAPALAQIFRPPRPSFA